MRENTSEPTSPRAPILVFLPLDCVGEVFSYMACCISQIGAGARVNDGNVE